MINDPPSRDYHNEIRAERDKLRAEVERLTRERKMTLIQFEETVARLADDKAHFKARAEAAEQKLAMERDAAWKASAQSQEERCIALSNSIGFREQRDKALDRAEAAERKLQQRADELNVLRGSIAAYQTGELERKLAMAVESLTLLADLHDAAGMPNCAARKKARAAVAALEKNDE